MNKSESIGEIAKALLATQKIIGAAAKKSKNPFFKSAYADLSEVIDTVKEPLNANGITFLQIIDEGEHGAVVETTLLHESGEYISGRTPVFVVTKRDKSGNIELHDPQALGSGITYSKRYGLQAICGLPTEDDDGEKAMSRKPKVLPIVAVNKLIKTLKKTDEDISNMIEFVKEDPVVVGLKDLSDIQLNKILRVLERQA